MNQSPLKSTNNESLFDLTHHGDEIIVGLNQNGHLEMAVKIQTGIGEHRSTLLTFETQSQCERLFPAIMKGLK